MGSGEGTRETGESEVVEKVLHLKCDDSTGLGVLAAHVEGKLSHGDLGERTTVAEILDLERRSGWG
jgi:hypothetical protein